jgi:hypothetical protein
MLCCLPPIANIMTATGTTHSDGQKDMHQLWQEKEIKPPPNDEQIRPDITVASTKVETLPSANEPAGCRAQIWYTLIGQKTLL